MDDLPLEKLSISGPTLSSLINRFASSHGDFHGLLFGNFSLFTPSSLSDDNPSPSPSSLIVTLTGFLSTTTAFSDLTTLLRHHNHPHHRLIGWFSGRRRSPLRPSLREFSLTHSLSESSQIPDSRCVFLLLTTPVSESQTLIHTHDYKAYQYHDSMRLFEGLAIDVVNIGPAFRGHYSNFCPASKMPWMGCEIRLGSPMREDEKEKERESLNEMKRVGKDQKDLDSYAEGYELGKLSRLTGSDAVSYVDGVEELYEKMLARLDSLAKLVESSSSKVLEQENYNMKLRYRVAGLE